jgi:DNA-binding LacI/PurR family transcriptional regulator
MPTIKEVADLAGVSVGTVSHVVSGAVPVSEPLRLKVQEAIRELDYHPNHVARSLKTSRTRTLGIIVPDMTISFYPLVIRGAESAAWKQGYSLIAVNSTDNADRQRELLSLLRSQRVEGILVVVAAAPVPVTEITRLIEAGIPVVCLDRIPEKLPADSVSVEDVSAAEMGTDHLLEVGYRRIAIVTGPLSLTNEKRRQQGYEQSLQRAGITNDPELHWHGNVRPDDVAALCGRKLDSLAAAGAPPPDAVFCTNGPTALGALRALRERGLSTPEDVGFLTFDELTVDDLFKPAITTIVQPAYEIGFKAAEILFQRIQGKGGDEIAAPRTIRLPASLKIRESTQRSSTVATLST